MANTDAQRECEQRLIRLQLLAQLYETELTIKAYNQIPQDTRTRIQQNIDTTAKQVSKEINAGTYGKNLWQLFNDTPNKHTNKTQQLINNNAGDQLQLLYEKGRCLK